MKRSDWPMRANGGGRRGRRNDCACAAGGAARGHHMSGLRDRRFTFASAVEARLSRGSARTGMVQ